MGQVTAVDGMKITVQMGTSTQTIVTDANTKFTLAGGTAGTLADVKVGQYVMAQTAKQTNGSLLASQVVVSDQPGKGPGRKSQHGQGAFPGNGPNWQNPSPTPAGTQS